MSTNKEQFCPLCLRVLGDINISKHHLLPKSQGGKYGEVVLLHNICHQKIHSLFTEKEIKNRFYSIELLSANEEIQKFIKWVAKKDPTFYEKNKKTNRRKNR